jgi:ribosomal protein L11 methylase PrmA
MIDNLEAGIHALTFQRSNSEWTNYYQDNNYSNEGLKEKELYVESFLDNIRAATLWDLGSNTGRFSRLAAGRGIATVSFDADHACVEKNYLECRRSGETHVLPLILDLSNPSPNIGWANQERMSIIERGPVDVILALALIHHLAIANNLPLPKLSQFFNQLCHTLIIEFVPKSDSQVKRLLATREDVFSDYTQEQFEVAFQEHFILEKNVKIPNTQRTLYLMRKPSQP